ncbi:DUF3592 domain-containing protein [Streptomyces sp. NPDC056144]|uniref:DUF3592 domain-containing protein n=1 Tax=unclassified Streptomyces TaxID=2593676 RepID=UPI0035D73AB3
MGDTGELLTMVLITATSVFLSVVGALSLRSGVALMRRGVRVDAKVVGVREHEDDGDVRYYPIIHFTPPDGSAVQGEVGFRLNDYSAPETISVYYDPLRPQTFAESRWDELGGGVLWLLIGVPATGWCLWWFFH